MDTGNGDAGRLSHILEFLKHNRVLYYSDHTYLEHKLNSSFSTIEEPSKENTILPKIQQLIDTGNGDLGRLQHIYDMIANEKSLYHSDQVYLETKLQSPIQEPTSISVESSKTKQMFQYTSPPKKEILKEQRTSKLRGIMPKDWTLKTDSEERRIISKNILDE